jgi:hypothetical protein
LLGRGRRRERGVGDEEKGGGKGMVDRWRMLIWYCSDVYMYIYNVEF